MPIKRVSIKHLLRRGFLEKGLEHYLRNRLRTVFKAIPENIEDFEVSRCCEIFRDILISQNIICF